MRLLICGAGVIGGYLCHVLCRCGHEVHLLARGQRREELERDGLVLYHRLQHRKTVDHPILVREVNPAIHYDAVFTAMQYWQTWAFLDDLAAADTGLVVLIGNNPAAAEMDAALRARSPVGRTYLYGFSSTGGRRAHGQVICVRLGAAGLTCGGLHSEPPEEIKRMLADIFTGKYRVRYTPDADAWLKCHAVCILPLAWVCYAHGCDLTRASMADARRCVQAMVEGYGLLKSLGYPIMPEGDEELAASAVERGLLQLFYWGVFKSRTIGSLSVSDHCRAAQRELAELEAYIQRLREQNAAFPMPVWDGLREDRARQ